MKNKAFTLIELLVVVLIIGILAAIALPQYQVAVEKSRAARILPLLRSLNDARTSYYLANGELPCHIEDLDISFPYESKTETGARYSCTEKDYKYEFSDGSYISLGSVADLIFYSSANAEYHIDVYREKQTWDTQTGNIVCVANITISPLGERLCKSLGTYIYDDDNGNQKKYVVNF